MIEDKQPEADFRLDDGIEMVEMYGDLVGALAAVSDVMLSPLVKVGTIEGDREVLVPFVEFQLTAIDLSGEQNDETEQDIERYATILPFENAAFLLADLSEEFMRACEQLSYFAAGQLTIEHSRIAQSAQFADRALKAINGARDKLNELTIQTANSAKS